MSGNSEVLRLILDSQKLVDAGMKLEGNIMGSATQSGKVEMLKLVLERAGFPTDDNVDTEGKKWKGERLTEEQRASIEKNLCRSTSGASLDSLRLLLSYLIQPNEDRSFQYYLIKDNADIIGIFNATEDAMPKDSPEVFELVWESFLSPPSSILDADPKAKVLQQEWLHRRLISAAHDGALKTAALIIEKYKANPNHISIKYHYTPVFLTAALGHVELLRYLWQDSWATRLSAVIGDLTQPRLGLSDDTWKMLGDAVDVVIHNGALVHWVKQYRHLERSNVLSTIDALRLCNQGKPKLFSFISSTSVLDTDHYINLSQEQTSTGQGAVMEADDMMGSRSGLGTGYGQSKWVSSLHRPLSALSDNPY
jgi:hypothetical protein